jgi:gluconokinase
MRALVIMGVAGCGKSTVAAALCERTGARLIEGDAFHPESNVRKMSAGIPLTDADREGWLIRLGQALRQAVEAGEPAALTCSALKHRYRDTLRAAVPDAGFVFLALTPAEATERVAHRAGHFMPASLIESQFRDLEPPIDEPRVLTVRATAPLLSIVDAIDAWWR